MDLIAENTSLKEEISDLKQQVNWLMEQLQLSTRRQFGVSSEESDWEQTSFFNETEATADKTAPEPELETVKEHRRKKRTAADRIPPDLPVEVVEHNLPEQDKACPECGHNMHVMGHDERDPQEFLRDFKGYLHADGYDGYHNLPQTITVVGCWAHLRRKFDETLKTLPEKNRKGTKAWIGLEFCNKLFHIEKQLKLLSPEKLKIEREIRSSKVIADFYAWISSTTVLPKSLLGQAVGYAVSQKKYLENYLKDGRLEISNNRAERSIKLFVIGRKNWLFSNTPNGATASEIFYSLIETAKENGINPYTYLTHVFRTAPNLPEGEGIEELLPFK